MFGNSIYYVYLIDIFETILGKISVIGVFDETTKI
jgi:hypothetical protein